MNLSKQLVGLKLISNSGEQDHFEATMMGSIGGKRTIT